MVSKVIWWQNFVFKAQKYTETIQVNAQPKFSVTRFGEISPLWQKYKSIQVFGQICDIIGLIIIVANGQILKNNLTTWSRCQTVPNVEKGMWFKIFSQIYISFFEHVVRRCQVKKSTHTSFSTTTTRWNNALWLDVPRRVSSFNQSECIVQQSA